MVYAGDIIRADDSSTDWADFTPSWTNLTVGNGSVGGRWRRVGNKTIELRAQFTFGSTSSIGGNLGLTLPGGLSGEGSTLRQAVPAWLMDSSASSQWAVGLALLQAGGGTALDSLYGPTTAFARWNATNPITWANGDICLVQGFVEVTT